MTEKSKVYQGVRVKITVKELLQQRRALQAETNAIYPASRIASVPVSESIVSSSSSSCSGPYFETKSVPLAPNLFHPTAPPSQAPHEDTSCYLDQHLLESYLQPEPFADTFLATLQASSQDYTTGNPQAASARFNQSLCPESPSDSSDFSSSFDYSCSPPHQMLPFAPQSFSSPSHPETRSCAFNTTSEYPLHVQYTPSACYCSSCIGAECLETIQATDYYTYPSVEYTDYHPTTTVAEDLLWRGMNTWDMCYS
ncbi:POU class 2 homeobox associating factor 3 [Pleurodeles waltl]|uniref:POU class 2 homeobox associating factor 3 n=1 Tax=Pleurodeles waltl TaxID=8319 RepID=UPI00370999DB